MQAQPPAITDLERGGGFYALLFVLFWVGVAVFVLGKVLLKMVQQQIDRGHAQTEKLIASFDRSIELHREESLRERRLLEEALNRERRQR